MGKEDGRWSNAATNQAIPEAAYSCKKIAPSQRTNLRSEKKQSWSSPSPSLWISSSKSKSKFISIILRHLTVVTCYRSFTKPIHLDVASFNTKVNATSYKWPSVALREKQLAHFHVGNLFISTPEIQMQQFWRVQGPLYVYQAACNSPQGTPIHIILEHSDKLAVSQVISATIHSYFLYKVLGSSTSICSPMQTWLSFDSWYFFLKNGGWLWEDQINLGRGSWTEGVEEPRWRVKFMTTLPNQGYQCQTSFRNTGRSSKGGGA